MPNGIYQTPDLKKLEYKKYLDKTGVNDALTKVLVGLYEEPDRPANAIDYIKKYLGAQSGVTEYDKMKKENDDLKLKIKELEHCIGDLRRQIMKEEEEREKREGGSGVGMGGSSGGGGDVTMIASGSGSHKGTGGSGGDHGRPIRMI